MITLNKDEEDEMTTGIPVLLVAIEYRFQYAILKFAQEESNFEIVVEKDSDVLDTLEPGHEYNINLDLVKT